MITTNLSDFGYRELDMLCELLEAMKEHCFQNARELSFMVSVIVDKWMEVK